MTEKNTHGGDDRNLSERAIISRILKEHLRPHLGRILLAAFFMIIVAGTTGATAYLLDPAIEGIFVDKNAEQLYLVPGIIVGVIALKAAATYGQSVLMNYVGQRIIADTQRNMFANVMHADLAWLHEIHSGQLISSFLYDVGLLREAVSKAVTGIAKDLMTFIALVGVMVYQDWQLAFFALVVVPIAGVYIRRLSKRMRRATHDSMDETGVLSTLLSETLDGTRTIKAYGQEDHEISRVGASIERRLGHIMAQTRAQAASSPLTEFLSGFGIAAVIFYGGLRGMNGDMSLGQFMSFLGAVMMAYQPMKSLAKFQTVIQEGIAAAARTFSILDLKAEVADGANAKELVVSKGAINMTDVSFRYSDGTQALNTVSIEIPAGKTVALVGASGAGKTTVLNLIPRFYDVQVGTIVIDNQSITDVTLKSLRQNIGLVSQESFLFDDTIRANITYGRPDADDAAIEKAVRDAGALEFIQAMPNGLETIVGEGGVKLSGGQRQRLSIARAMLKNAPILLLDEATSALDSETEQQVQAALTELMQGRTVLVIAHRLSTIRGADIICVMDRGQLVDQGSHEELISRGGIYARLYKTQFSESTAGLIEVAS